MPHLASLISTLTGVFISACGTLSFSQTFLKWRIANFQKVLLLLRLYAEHPFQDKRSHQLEPARSKVGFGAGKYSGVYALVGSRTSTI
jgi:hypothetical protein